MAQFGAGVGGAVKLDGLTDVNVGASPANSSVLVYSTATDTWGAGHGRFRGAPSRSTG